MRWSLLVCLIALGITPAPGFAQPAAPGVVQPFYQQKAEILYRGATVAIQRGALPENSQLHQAIQALIAAVRSGVPLSEAAQQLGLNQNTVQRLVALGQAAQSTSPVPVAYPSPIQPSQPLVPAVPYTSSDQS